MRWLASARPATWPSRLGASEALLRCTGIGSAAGIMHCRWLPLAALLALWILEQQPPHASRRRAACNTAPRSIGLATLVRINVWLAAALAEEERAEEEVSGRLVAVCSAALVWSAVWQCLGLQCGIAAPQGARPAAHRRAQAWRRRHAAALACAAPALQHTPPPRNPDLT